METNATRIHEVSMNLCPKQSDKFFPLDTNLVSAKQYMRRNFEHICPHVDHDGDIKFTQFTTLSFQQIRDGANSLLIGDYIRKKASYMNILKESIHVTLGTKSFLSGALKGVEDV